MLLLQKSIQGAVMILAIVVIRALFINKLPKKTFLILWAATVFFLLFPFSFKSKFSVYSLVEKEGIRIMGTARDTSSSVRQIAGQGSAGGFGAEKTPADSGGFENPGNLKELQEETEDLAGEEEIWQKGGAAIKTNGDIWTLCQSFFQSGVWRFIWLIGLGLCAGYFCIVYFQCRRAFAVSLPVKNETADKWLDTHCLRRKIAIRQSGGILAPLTYGIISPVILMPKNTDWGCKEAEGIRTSEGREGFAANGEKPPLISWELSLCLEHEFVHIKRMDGVTKLVLTAVLCLHWFNPLVWVMYVLANRDLELSCDEAVVRIFGENVKSAYARTLIHMEERKSAFLPLCNNFSKNAIEERITAIMKIKKFTLFTAAAAAILVVGITLAFATQAAGKGESRTDIVKEILGSDYTQEECEMLASLWFEDYENMTVADFQEKAWSISDTSFKYMELEERLSNIVMEDGQRGEEPDFWEYYRYIYEPLTAEKWKDREFGGYARKDLATMENPDFPKADLEYFFTLSVLRPKELTVKEYDDTRRAIKEDLRAFWQDRTVEELADEAGMKETVSAEIKRIVSERGSEKLAVSIDYFFNPVDIDRSLSDKEENKANAKSSDRGIPDEEENEREERTSPYGTRADYDSLLSLRTQGYESLTLEEFNERLLDWCNQNPGAMERTGADAFNGDYQVALTEEEKRFAALTVQLSRFENAQQVTSWHTGKPEEDPWWGGGSKQYIESRDDMWCRLYFQFPYHISDKAQVTVGERDQCIEGMMERILKFWESTELEERIKISEEEVVRRFEEWAAECSSGKVTVRIDKDQIRYEAIDEREYADERVYLGTVSTKGYLGYYISAGAEEENSKYFHLTVANGTEKEISAIKYAMVAYDGEGRPMEVFWNFMDSGKAASYECIVEEQRRILPGEVYDKEGGWSIYDLDSPWRVIDLSRYGEGYRVEYVLSCMIEITFEDGTNWSNTDYENWRTAFCGAKVPYSVLGEYSQREYEIFGSRMEN